jgi:catechol 2,3-dioxygenase-like lactoylglutathione lyase family enzyme
MTRRLVVGVLGALWVLGSETVGAEAIPVPLAPRLVAIVVPDLARAKTWYSDLLGFTAVEEKAFPEMGLRICLLRSGEFELELVQNKNAVRRADLSSEKEIEGFAKLAFTVGDLDKLHSRMVAAGTTIVRSPSKSTRTGQGRYMLVRDDSGNLLQFIESPVPSRAVNKRSPSTVLASRPFDERTPEDSVPEPGLV